MLFLCWAPDGMVVCRVLDRAAVRLEKHPYLVNRKQLGAFFCAGRQMECWCAGFWIGQLLDWAVRLDCY